MKKLVSHVATPFVTLVVALAASAALTSPAAALPAWQDHATSWTNPKAKDPRVVDLRYATHAHFDRVVIEIHGANPSGHAFYAKKFFYDGSGAPVPIKGRSGLGLDLSPARAHTLAGDNLYVGPQVARPHFDTLKALAFTGDFEGHVSFAFALTHRADYRIFRLHSPERLVLDFRH